MHELRFNQDASSGNNDFHPGINTTVRLGNRYSRLLPGHTVLLLNLDREVLGSGVVMSTTVCYFKHIPLTLLTHEHDPTCRELSGLKRCMDNCYGRPMQSHDIVTVISFYFGG